MPAPRIVGVAAGIGLLAGITLLGVVEALSRGWSGLSAYNQSLLGIGVTHESVSFLLVLFVAGFVTAYFVDTPLRRTGTLAAALTGLTAMIVARSLLFVQNPVYLVQSLLMTWLQVLLLVGGAMLVAAVGGLVASSSRGSKRGAIRTFSRLRQSPP